jgi:hypothetical protein
MEEWLSVIGRLARKERSRDWWWEEIDDADAWQEEESLVRRRVERREAVERRFLIRFRRPVSPDGLLDEGAPTEEGLSSDSSLASHYTGGQARKRRRRPTPSPSSSAAARAVPQPLPWPLCEHAPDPLVPARLRHLCSRCGWTGHNRRSCVAEWRSLEGHVASGRIAQMREEGLSRMRKRLRDRRKESARRARVVYHEHRGTSLKTMAAGGSVPSGTTFLA